MSNLFRRCSSPQSFTLAVICSFLLASPLQAEELKPSELDAASVPIRVQRPWLLTINAGNINSTMLDMQFNFNEYFAVHGAAGLGASQSNTVTFPESGFILEGGGKAYFNPHDLAGFVDLSFSSNTFINAMLGVEYRHEKGLTFSVAAGAGYNIRTNRFGFVYPANSSSFLPAGTLLKAGVGYAF